ncbi:MAG: sulfate ABC transporter substrate-binding protein [Nitrococcus sp.]|nr:sulfate ABC transporter substrate-binding protein [Nitrococcus sp.]
MNRIPIKPLTSIAAAIGLSIAAAAHAQQTLLNASYDPTRELYQEYNAEFAKRWEQQHGEDVTIRMSHGGSSKQARSVIDGLEADVVSLATPVDVDAIANKTDLINEDWRQDFEHITPYTTVQVLVVRKGNPKHIEDWDDLIREDVAVITPNPKTSGSARWNFLAAWHYARENLGGNTEAREFVTKLYRNVPVLDTGARGATNTFVRNGIGDVLITYENEALLILEKLGQGQYEIVVPSSTVLVEPAVAVVDGNATKSGTTELARAYVKGLYTDWGQRIIAQYNYRPRDAEILDEFSDLYKPVETFTVAEAFGSWAKAQEKFFSGGGVFDQIYAPAP